jgi:GNAT superfamily N-acetyltransferase/ubiquinone/menaquinone biosynthesis C-methylase UbiE
VALRVRPGQREPGLRHRILTGLLDPGKITGKEGTDLEALRLKPQIWEGGHNSRLGRRPRARRLQLVHAVPVEAALPSDAEAILALRRSLEHWLETRGIEQWGPGEVELSDVRRQVSQGEWQVLRTATGLAGAMRLLWSDEPVWRDENAFGAYVHGLMVDRAAAGRGVGTQLLDWAEAQAREVGAPVLRMDCVESNSRLRRYYAEGGFSEVGRRDFDGPWHSAVLLEKVLREATRLPRSDSAARLASGDVAGRDWRAWHEPYEDPQSPLMARLREVQVHVKAWLGERGDRPSTVVSACAGQGRDLLDVLAATPRHQARARLVEADPVLAAQARHRAAAAGLTGVEVITGDAGSLSAYADIAPADLVLMCGVFGNISDEDVRRTIAGLTRLSSLGGTVIWTRHRREPDLTPEIRAWFSKAGFRELAFTSPGPASWSVGVVRRVDETCTAVGDRLFTFV